MNQVQCVILGGGRGQRLYPLTRYRSKPAVPIGGKYRLIDIPISNALHAGLDQIYVLTQYSSASLHRHIKRTYSFDAFTEGFVDILAAEQTQTSASWYLGTADAVRQQLPHILHDRPDEVLILSGDHLYRMDFLSFVHEHRARQADVSVAVMVVDRSVTKSFGILQVDDDDRVVAFHEKPATDADRDKLRVPDPKGGDEAYLASMGIYLFRAEVLASLLEECQGDDFGKHILPFAITKKRLYAHRFRGYWEDIGTIEAFYRANLGLTNPDAPFHFHEPGAPIFTHPRYLASAWLDRCEVERATIGDGSLIRDARISHSLIGIRSLIHPGALIANTIMMGADYFETPDELEHNRRVGRPNIGVGANTVIDGAIIDKNACIGENVRIVNEKGIRTADGDNYCIRDGIVVIPKHAYVPDGTVI